jgi:hypothetical protein
MVEDQVDARTRRGPRAGMFRACREEALATRESFRSAGSAVRRGGFLEESLPAVHRPCPARFTDPATQGPR